MDTTPFLPGEAVKKGIEVIADGRTVFEIPGNIARMRYSPGNVYILSPCEILFFVRDLGKERKIYEIFFEEKSPSRVVERIKEYIGPGTVIACFFSGNYPPLLTQECKMVRVTESGKSSDEFPYCNISGVCYMSKLLEDKKIEEINIQEEIRTMAFEKLGESGMRKLANLKEYLKRFQNLDADLYQDDSSFLIYG